MARLICGCLVWLLALSVIPAEAARQKPVVRPASAQDTFKKGTSTLDIERHWGEVIDVQGGRVNLPVVQTSKFNPARIAGLLKDLIKNNPLKVAGTAAGIYLIDMLPGASFDPLTGQPLFTSSGSLVPLGNAPGNYYWRAEASPYPTGASVESACRAYVATKSSSQIYRSHSVNQVSGGGSCIWGPSTQPHIITDTPIARFGSTCPPDSSLNVQLSGCYGVVTSPMTDSQIEQLVSNTPTITEPAWSELGGILTTDIPGSFDYPDGESFDGPSSIQGDPIQTTTLDHVTGNTTVSETVPTHNFDYSTNPLSITTTTTSTTNNYQNGNLVSTTTVTESPAVSEVQPPEIPTDCDFMPTVCDFIDWVREPFNEEEPDLSELITDEDFERDFNFSSNASCPAPLQIATSRDTYEFSFEPACEWAGMIKPFFLIAALITAIYLNLGVFRGGH